MKTSQSVAIPALAKVLGISRYHACSLARSGKIRAQRLPGDRSHWRVSVDEARRVAATMGIDFDRARAEAKP